MTRKATDQPIETTVPVPGGYVLVRRSSAGISLYEFEHGEDDPDRYMGDVTVPPTVDALSAVITQMTLLLTDLRRAEAQAETAERCEATARWLARVDADPEVDSGLAGKVMSPETMAAVAR